MESSVILFLGSLGGTEMIVIGIIFIIFFGAKKLPELARGLGQGIKEFKNATKEVKNNIEEATKSED